MPAGDMCPKCGAFTLVWESEYNRWACLKLDCGYTKYKDERKTKILEKEEGEE